MALVLNPADMTFVKPSDSQFILESTHLRILVISNHVTFQAQVQIDDGELIELSQTEANTPLYTGILNIFFFNQSLVNKFLNIYEFKALENNTRILMLYIAFLNVANISAL